jgi:hypothetical protein
MNEPEKSNDEYSERRRELYKKYMEQQKNKKPSKSSGKSIEQHIPTIIPPQYLVEAAQDPNKDYYMFVIEGTHPPKWIFEAENIGRGATVIGAGLAQSNPTAYKWNTMRRAIANGQNISQFEYYMLVVAVLMFQGDKNDWFKACERFVFDNVNKA